MKRRDDSSFADRRKTADSAKKALLEKFSAAPKADDPAVQERLAARQAVAEAREARRAERDALKIAERERLAAEAEAAAAEAGRLEREEAEAREAKLNESIARVMADEAARKAERDRRYAARKARKA